MRLQRAIVDTRIQTVAQLHIHGVRPSLWLKMDLSYGLAKHEEHQKCRSVDVDPANNQEQPHTCLWTRWHDHCLRSRLEAGETLHIARAASRDSAHVFSEQLKKTSVRTQSGREIRMDAG